MRARPSVLPSGMRLVGDVRGEDDFVVLGTIEGELQVEGTVVVEEGATVQGNVRGRSVAIRGVLVGDAMASDSIRVDAGGRVVGDLHAPRVNLVRGALFRGHVHMTETAAAVPMRRPRTRLRTAALKRGQSSLPPPRPSDAAHASNGEGGETGRPERPVQGDSEVNRSTNSVQEDGEVNRSTKSVQADFGVNRQGPPGERGLGARPLKETDTLVESLAPTMVERPSVDEGRRRPPAPIFPAVGRTRARRVTRDRP